jgi:hypothetical protein
MEMRTLLILVCSVCCFPACSGDRILQKFPYSTLGKMLIMGAVFRCIDPILTVVAGLSVRDPFLLPQEKKDVSLLISTIGVYISD